MHIQIEVERVILTENGVRVIAKVYDPRFSYLRKNEHSEFMPDFNSAFNNLIEKVKRHETT